MSNAYSQAGYCELVLNQREVDRFALSSGAKLFMLLFCFGRLTILLVGALLLWIICRGLF